MVPPWATETEPGIDDSEDWTNNPGFYENIGLWTVNPGFYVFGEWTDEANPDFDDADTWKAFLIPTSNPAASFLGVSEAPEDFHLDPLDAILEPEEIQADCEDWIIEPEAD